MKSTALENMACICGLALLLSGCGASKADPAAEAPPQVQVEREQDLNVVRVDHPEQYPLAAAGSRAAASQLAVTGVVTPDVSRTVPVVTLATGRVIEIDARLGDTVTKGQLLLRVQSSDIAGAFSDYRKAVADETLAKTQLDRSKDLYAHGAAALNDLQIAQDTETKAQVDVETTAEHLRLLGSDPARPVPTVDLLAPVAGVITDQQVTNAGGLQGLGSTPFTISDLSSVWILCDVYENDLPSVRVGQAAQVRLNAFPDRVLRGNINNIGQILDPNIRTAKVRVQVNNPGFLRVGMFATAIFESSQLQNFATVPAAAILHLHDRDLVFVPAGGGQFRRTEVTSGEMLPNNQQEIVSGLAPGQQVVANALALENTVEQ